jgi:hypothetical protein
MTRTWAQYRAVGFSRSGNYRDHGFPSFKKAKAAALAWTAEDFDRVAVYGVASASATPVLLWNRWPKESKPPRHLQIPDAFI